MVLHGKGAPDGFVTLHHDDRPGVGEGEVRERDKTMSDILIKTGATAQSSHLVECRLVAVDLWATEI
jgi:hypothetical protein